MELTNKTKAIIAGVALTTSFAVGRYSVNTTPAVRTVADSKVDNKKNTDKDTHTVTTITTTKKPDGTITETKKIDSVTEARSSETKDSVYHLDQTITPPPKQSKLNISVLGGNDFSRGLLVSTYGLSVNKEVWGPLTVGAFGMANGLVGISIGLDF